MTRNGIENKAPQTLISECKLFIIKYNYDAYFRYCRFDMPHILKHAFSLNRNTLEVTQAYQHYLIIKQRNLPYATESFLIHVSASSKVVKQEQT